MEKTAFTPVPTQYDIYFKPIDTKQTNAKKRKKKDITFTVHAYDVDATPRLSALDLDLTNVPVSAILPPRSTLSLRLRLLPFPHPVPLPISAPVPAPTPTPPPRPRAPDPGNVSLCGKYDTTGDPYDDDNDGGGTLGYVNACTFPTPYPPPGTTPFDCTDDDDGGVVMCVPLLNTLLPAGACAERTGENGNGDSVDEGEYDSGVVVSGVLFCGRWIDDDGRGIGTPCDGIGTACVVGRADEYTTDVLGDDTPDIDDRRCVGCENGSKGVNPTRLSTDNPS